IGALLIAASMLISLAACGKSGADTTGNGLESESTSAVISNEGGESAAEMDSSQAKELVTITLYPAAGNISSGIIGGWKGEYFASLGFEIEVWAFSDEKTNAILASGDLPDIMYVPETNRDDMIESGMLLNLDGYLDDMPHAQSYEPLETALNYIREYKSAGTGSIFGLPTTVGENSTKVAYVDSTERNALKLKWEVYEAIGTPEMNDIWDVIDVMEMMVEYMPADEDGNPYYGTILNNGSDSAFWACMTMFYRFQGYQEYQLPYLLETNMATGENTSILSEGSLYYEGLKWYNEIYRRGLMDPDSINNDRPTQKAKVDAGYAMIPSGYLPGWASGYYEYYIPDTDIYFSYNSIYGGQLIGINAETENIEACLAFLDMLCDADASLIITHGPEGEYWYADENGNAFFTDRAIAHLESAASGDSTGFELSTGEKLELWNTPWVVNSAAKTTYMDGEGNPRICRATQWKEANEISSSNETFKKWQETTGYETWKELLNEQGAYYSDGLMEGIRELCTLPDDNMQLIVDALKDVVVTASWKMVYASNETEFENIWNQMVADCEGLGAQDVIDWRLEDIKNAQDIKAELSK
ncbi:hypothetical protein LJC58_06795, partial [Lachnospiraceae bacterium OttesenSCG-928-D06]|nr:hypothetical protein [Lachnospiraceae bacterium OttesenSCG-928-D06]